MSDIRKESVVRFQFNEETCKEFNTWSKMYEFLKPFLNEAQTIDYDDEDGEEDVVSYFEYDAIKGNYSVKRSNKIWYLDYHIFSSEYSCEDFYSLISFEELTKIIEDTYILFGKRVENPKVISYQWYTGCDEPIHYDE